MTTSAAGLYGNFGQANYSAAKMGLVGLCNTLALEGAKNNISCNVIAPLAASRLTESVMPAEYLKMLNPEFVAPFVLYLCHESCPDNGALYETAAGWASKVRWQGTAGTQFRKWGALTPESVRDHWGELSDWSNATSRTSTNDTTMSLASSLQDIPKESETQRVSDKKSIDTSKIIGLEFPETKFSYTPRDVILFALGIGADVNKDSSAHLKFLYENHEDFSVLPTFGVLFSQVGIYLSALLRMPFISYKISYE